MTYTPTPRRRALTGLLLVTLIATLTARSDAGIFSNDTARITFQAYLTNNQGDPLPGPTVDLSFTVYDTIVGPLQGPIDMPATPIENGIVNVLVPVTGASFWGNSVELGVRVNNGPELTPRIKIGSVPYAFRVDRVENEELTDNIVVGMSGIAGTFEAVRNDGTTSVRVEGQTGLISTRDPSNQTRFSVDEYGLAQVFEADGTPVGRFTATGGGGDVTLYKAADGYPTFSANGNLGLVQALRGFDLYSPYTETSQGSFVSNSWGPWLTTRDETGSTTLRLGSASTVGGFIEVYRQAGGTSVFIDGDEGNGGGVISLRDGALNETIQLNAQSNRIYLFGDDGDQRAMISASTDFGLIELRNNAATPINTVRLTANATTGGQLILAKNSGNFGITLSGEDAGTHGGRIDMHNAASDTRIRLMGDDNLDSAGMINVMDESGANGVLIDGRDADGGSRVAINDAGNARIIHDAYESGGGGITSMYNSLDVQTVEIDADESDDAVIRLNDAAGTLGVGLYADAVTNAGAISVYDEDGTPTIQLVAAEAAGQGSQITLRKADGTATIELDAEFSGEGRIRTQVLEITGGADLSEQFHVTADDAAIQPGMVVCIDPKNPGKLVVSHNAYDRTVAGIVSGADGVKPGLLMGQHGTIADGAFPVALTGRVWCFADETAGAIQPGDLLTTSTISGACMKVTDYAKAQGAIIGKAMSGVNDGKVLVLVSLQ